MSSIPSARRGDFSCGIVMDPYGNGPEIIVAGGRGLDTVEIYNVNSDSWRYAGKVIT